MVFCRECYALRDNLIAKLEGHCSRLRAANEYLKQALHDRWEQNQAAIIRSRLDVLRAIEALEGHVAMHKGGR
jgi:hypothetical protein